MSQVVVTYNVWDANGAVIPAANEPEILFRPLTTSMVDGLISDREVFGTLNPTTGAGQVSLESSPGLFYVPILRWLKNPEDPQNRARGKAEWSPFFPGNGGPIGELPGVVPRFSAFFYGFGDPPSFLRVRNDVVYIDISGSTDGYWQPWVPEGTAVEV